MEQTKSSKVIHSAELSSIVQALANVQSGLDCYQVPSVDAMLDSTSHVYPWGPSFEEARDDPIVVLHSSGSTGLPKPITMTHGTWSVNDNDRNFPTIPGRRNHDSTVWNMKRSSPRIYEPFPPFHVAGFFNKIMLPVWTDVSIVFGPPLRPPSGALAAEIMRLLDVHVSLLPPVVAEELYHEPGGPQLLKKLDILCYAGGPLSQAIGDELVKHVVLCQFYGSTEVGQVRQLVPQRENWSYMEFHPSNKMRFDAAEDDAFELVVFADESTIDFSALNHNMPGVAEWHTKDLFRRHPSKRNLWSFYGRKDDIIVLSSGEKFNPVPMETLLVGDHSVSGALVIGQGRSRPALLIEPTPESAKNRARVIDSVWDKIEEANKALPKFARIIRSTVMLASHEKPMIRAAKGTVVRKLTEAVYSGEVDRLYSEFDNATKDAGLPDIEALTYTFQSVINLLRAIIRRVSPDLELSDQDNLYLAGIDSLQSMEAVSLLRSSIRKQRPEADLSWLTVDKMYINPSIQQLGELVFNFLNHGKILEQQDRLSEMEQVLQHYTSRLPKSCASQELKIDINRLTVILTGSTGSLGQWLLQRLLQNPAISRVYCINRSPSARSKWESQNSRGLPDKEVRFFTARFGAPKFGLSDDDHQIIVNDCHVLLHNAWKVDFNQALSSFADNLESTRSLIELCASSKNKSRIVFVSSISSNLPWGPRYKSSDHVPEEAIADLGAAMTIGYAESKQIAERMLSIAATNLGIATTVLRVGQISGPSAPAMGSWPEREVVPGILKTSKALGAIPSDLVDVDWLPIDKLAAIIDELTLHDLRHSPENPSFYNVVNPHRKPWKDFLPLMVRCCGRGTVTVPLIEWIHKLRSLNEGGIEQTDRYPALKTLKFFDIIAGRGPTATFATIRACSASETLANLPAIGPDLVAAVLKEST